MAWSWNKKRYHAAKLVAENEVSRERLCEMVGISLPTFYNWFRTPEFKAKVAEYQADIDAEMMRLPIAKKNVRVARLNDLQRRLELVVTDREEAYSQDEQVIGGRSGAIVKQYKSVGYGKESRIVEEHAFDAALFREIRAIDEQAAKELGQWVDKGELTGKNGTPLQLTEIVIELPAGSDSDSEEPEDDFDD